MCHSTGFAAVAIDYYGRTAGDGHRDDTFDWQLHHSRVSPAEVQLDVRAAMDYLAERAGGAVFTVGFCFGGGLSWRLAASDLDLAGAIGFYGRPELVRDVLQDITAPLLLLIAGNDAATPQEEFQTLATQLSEAGASSRCTSTEVRRIRSSTGVMRSGARPARTPGSASSASPAATNDDHGHFGCCA